MCRILFDTTFSGDHVLSEDSFDAFKKLAHTGKVPCTIAPGHMDGWGVVGWSDGKISYCERGIDPIEKHSFEIKNILQSATIVGHLRKATKGGILLENTQPFVMNGWVFVHNGTLYDIASFLRIPDDSMSDSYMFLLMLLDRITGRGGVSDILMAYREVFSAVHKHISYSSATSVLSNGRLSFIALDWNEEYGNRHRHLCLSDYYTLHWTVTQNGLLACSEQIDNGLSWNSLRNGQVLWVDSDTASWGVVNLADGDS